MAARRRGSRTTTNHQGSAPRADGARLAAESSRAMTLSGTGSERNRRIARRESITAKKSMTAVTGSAYCGIAARPIPKLRRDQKIYRVAQTAHHGDDVRLAVERYLATAGDPLHSLDDALKVGHRPANQSILALHVLDSLCTVKQGTRSLHLRRSELAE